MLIVLDKNGDLLKKYKNESTLLTDFRNRVWLSDGKTTKIIDGNFKEKNYNFTNLPAQDTWKIIMTQGEENQYFQVIDGDVFEIIENAGKFEVNPIEDLNKENFTVNKPIFYDKFSKKLFISTNWWSRFFVLEKLYGKWKIVKNPSFPFSVYRLPKLLTILQKFGSAQISDWLY